MNKEFKNVKEIDLESIAKELNILIQQFFKKNDRSCVVFLKGDLGAGKTTFTKSLGRVLNINETIISPTFVLRKDYPNMIHVDGYRFEKEEEGASLALDKEINEKGKIILIEWPERFVNAINLNPDFALDFRHVNDTERDISINTH